MTTRIMRLARKYPRRHSGTVELGIGLGLLATALTAIYTITVLTGAGQRFENAAVASAASLDAATVARAQRLLSVMSLGPVAACVSAIVVTALVRRLPHVAGAVTTLVVGAVATTEMLKRVVLPRPGLVDAPPSMTSASFPSGHVTVAIAVSVAAMFVTPRQWRTATALVGSLLTASVAASTIVVRWHRLGDVLGAYLIVAGWTLVAIRLADCDARPTAGGAKGRTHPAPRPLALAGAVGAGLALGWLALRALVGAGGAVGSLGVLRASLVLAAGAACLAMALLGALLKRT